MENFLIFYGPFIIVAVSIVLAFYVCSKDGPVK
ncbi:TPA: cytochrome bd oxidase small subunit CydS [Bacillus cereus]